MNNSIGMKRKWIKFRQFIPLYIMMIPGLTYLFINNYMPISGLVLAFKNYSVRKGIWGSDWAGLENFKYLFQTKDAWNITRNTILYNVAFIILGTILSVALAIFLNEITHKFMSSFFQTTLLLPHLVSIVVVAYIGYAFLSQGTGVLNTGVLKTFGIEPVSWYQESKFWPIILVIIHLWKNSGYMCIVYFASVVGIDKGYYEAASLDGATRWQQTIKITIPMLKPIIIMMVMLSVGRIFYSDFGLFYQVPMNSGPIQDVTSTIDTYVYRGLMKLGDIGMSAAAGLYQSIVGFILVLSANLLIRKTSPENSLF